jgi:hypothetical protein
MGDVELLLSVLELLLLAQQPVKSVTDANAASCFNITTDALGVWRDVLEGTTNVSHGAIHPSRLFGIGFEGIVDFADRQQASNFIKIRADATNDAHVDGIRWTNIANTFGFVHELAELVGAADCRGSGAHGEKLSFNHGGSRGSS